MIGAFAVGSQAIGANPRRAAPDTTAPVMSGALSISAVTSSGFTLSWPAASDNTGVAGYQVSTDGGATYGTLGTATSTSLTGKAPSTLYHCQVVALDAAGNISTPLSLDVTTTAYASAAGGGSASRHGGGGRHRYN